MNLLQTLSRSWPVLSMDDWVSYFTFNSNVYPTGLNQTLGGTKEEIDSTFAGLVQGAYKSNGVVFACMLVRLLLFSEARFIYRSTSGAGPRGDLFGGPGLAILDTPWPKATTGDLLARAIQDVDLAGNSFFVRRNQRGPRTNRLRRLRPDWVTIVLGSDTDSSVQAGDIDAETIGYLYHPGGKQSGRDPVPLLAEGVAHFAPIPDPTASFRGMSWLSPVISEILADGSATEHKRKFFQNGATPNMVVKGVPGATPEQFNKWVELFRTKHEGLDNAYKTMFLTPGVDATVVGSNLREIDFKITQGAGETRIAAAAGVPPVIVGLSEGLQAATYSNYAQARRRFADGTIRPLWRNLAGSLATVVDVPADAELWYDDRDIPFLHEDAIDATTIRQTQAASIKLLIDAGFEADTVVQAVTTGDMTRLSHTGLVSVQLLPPGTPMGGGNGKGPSDNKGMGLPTGAQASADEPADERAGRALAELISGRLNGQ